MTYLKTSFRSCASLSALLLFGCVNVVTDASTNSVTSTQTNINQVQNVSNGTGSAAQTAGVDFDAVVKKMTKRAMRFGTSNTTGVWVMCKVFVAPNPKLSQSEMLSMAEIRAKRDIAAWMSTSVQSESSLERSQVIEGNKSEIKEAYHELTKTNSEAFLRGVTLYTMQQDANGITAFYYSTGKSVDRAAELEAQLRATPPGVVRAVGFGSIINGQISKAKTAATQSALKNAVEQVMGTTVIGQSKLMDNEKLKSKVISQTVGNVKQYRVVKEGREGISYQVIVNAQVDEKSLLDNYAAMVRSIGNPGFCVKCQDPDLQTAFSGFLADLGFKVVNQETEAAFVVNGNCKYLDANHEYYGKGIQIDLNLQLIDKKSGQQYFSISNDPKFTTSFSGSLHQIRQSSAKKAFNKMRPELHAKLNKVVLDWVLNGRDIKVVFTNVPASVSEEMLEKMIADVPCATYHTRLKEGNKTVINCSYVGASADFSDFLLERLRKDLPEGTIIPKNTKTELNLVEFSF